MELSILDPALPKREPSAKYLKERDICMGHFQYWNEQVAKSNNCSCDLDVGTKHSHLCELVYIVWCHTVENNFSNFRTKSTLWRSCYYQCTIIRYLNQFWRQDQIFHHFCQHHSSVNFTNQFQHGTVNAFLKPMLQRDFISLLPKKVASNILSL